MFNLGSSTLSNTSLFGQSTPNNQNRSGTSFLFGNSTAQPSTLTSTPFSSPNVFGTATPVTNTLQASATGTGTIHRFDPVIGIDKVTKNGSQSQIRTKLCNLCAMPAYEKKSTEELRLEDYIDNRKFATPATNSLFPSAMSFTTTTSAATSSLFGPSLTTSTSQAPATTSFFGNSTTTAAPTLGGMLFGAQPAVSSAPTLSFAFGGSPNTTSAAPLTFGSAAPITSTSTMGLFGNTTPATSTLPFGFGSSQATATSTATTAPAFSFGGGNSLFPTATTAGTTSFGFPVSKPATGGTFQFTTTAPTPALNLFSGAPATSAAAPVLFSMSNQPAPTTAVYSTQSSVDTRTHLQLFQTMLNIQPFNSELGFLARNIKPNIGLDRSRLRTAPDPASFHSLNNVFSPLLTKPSVLGSNTTTPPSALANHPLPTHSHTLPSILLPSSKTAVTSTTNTLGLFGKRKLADSFLDDDEDNALMMDDGPSPSMAKLSKAHVIKRPRVLDMNKIRSVVLGGPSIEASRRDEENPSETFVVKSSADQLSGWKKFSNYDTYLASKKPPVETLAKVEKLDVDDDAKQLTSIKAQLEQARAFRLPRLTHDDYYTTPSIDELRHQFSPQGQCLVKEFTVGREHYGSVTFRGARMNLAGLDLDRLVEIGRRQVTVYPDDRDKPAEGDELNCQAIISLFGVYPIDRSSSNSGEEVTDPDRLIEMNYDNYLREMTRKFQGKFIDYDVYTGTWKFQVEHF